MHMNFIKKLALLYYFFIIFTNPVLAKTGQELIKAFKDQDLAKTSQSLYTGKSLHIDKKERILESRQRKRSELKPSSISNKKLISPLKFRRTRLRNNSKFLKKDQNLSGKLSHRLSTPSKRILSRRHYRSAKPKILKSITREHSNDTTTQKHIRNNIENKSVNNSDLDQEKLLKKSKTKKKIEKLRLDMKKMKSKLQKIKEQKIKAEKNVEEIVELDTDLDDDHDNQSDALRQEIELRGQEVAKYTAEEKESQRKIDQITQELLDNYKSAAALNNSYTSPIYNYTTPSLDFSYPPATPSYNYINPNTYNYTVPMTDFSSVSPVFPFYNEDKSLTEDTFLTNESPSYEEDEIPESA